MIVVLIKFYVENTLDLVHTQTFYTHKINISSQIQSALKFEQEMIFYLIVLPFLFMQSGIFVCNEYFCG